LPDTLRAQRAGYLFGRLEQHGRQASFNRFIDSRDAWPATLIAASTSWR
jgi:hypothetical protein